MIPISYPSPRVSQLDAYILDSELLSLLKQNLTSIFNLHNNQWWTYDHHPELWDLILNVIVFRLTTWKNGSSYGLSLQNLKLVNFRNGRKIGFTKRSLLLGFIIGDYMFSKFQSYLYSDQQSEPSNFTIINSIKQFIFRHKNIILTKVNNSLKVLNLINFLLFLISGRYPSLIHRVLGISLTPVVSDLLKFNGDNVNFEFQNRQLVWNVMTEFLVFILPLLQLKKLRKMSQKLLSPYKKDDVQQAPLSNLPVSQCAFCFYNKERALLAGEKKIASVSTNITNPHITNCGHIYCYVCLASLFSAADAYDGFDGCLRCGEKLQWFKKYGEDGDIDEDAILVEYEEVEEEDPSEEEEEDEDHHHHQEYNEKTDNSESENESEFEFDQEQAFDEDGGEEEFEEEFEDDLDTAMEL
ncbi:hypothetical protein CLIB1444_04S00342 [[Candida] jaroonii]|uniref:Uncharacterized protein n=1 Tax=[Candida] jaroonii TaxID=467808 RepID=A0ACA9Y610_9ASCO|nr:hypothetical protein CLIB1444_04S00342 [[Candida] jaroonii]